MSSQDEQGNPFIYFEDKVFSEQESMEIMEYHSAYRDVRRELQKRRNERGFVKRGRDGTGGKSKGKRSTVLARERANSTRVPKL